LTIKLAPFNIENIIFLCCNASYLIEVVNCTEPSLQLVFLGYAHNLLFQLIKKKDDSDSVLSSKAAKKRKKKKKGEESSETSDEESTDSESSQVTFSTNILYIRTLSIATLSIVGLIGTPRGGDKFLSSSALHNFSTFDKLVNFEIRILRRPRNDEKRRKRKRN
jgi:hypothetical protein